MAQSKGIYLKKSFGQHFLRDQSVVEIIVNTIPLSSNTSVFEIGCGDGFLTKEILKKDIARLWAFEIDPEWATFVTDTMKDDRLTVHQENFLDIDFSVFEPNKPWVILANLPYQVTFPILYRLQQHRGMLQEGVVMVQEEVAQKIVKTSGRGYGFSSLFLQHFFEWKLLAKVPPTAFYPPPKVHSRLLYLKTRKNIQPIPQEKGFWKFIKAAFRQPRRMLKNNLGQAHYDVTLLPESLLLLRAQQLGMEDFLQMWEVIQK